MGTASPSRRSRSLNGTLLSAAAFCPSVTIPQGAQAYETLVRNDNQLVRHEPQRDQRQVSTEPTHQDQKSGDGGNNHRIGAAPGAPVMQRFPQDIEADPILRAAFQSDRHPMTARTWRREKFPIILPEPQTARGGVL